MAIFSELNNRELAVIIWTLIFFIWAISKEKVRAGLVSLVKAFFAKKMVFGYLLMLLYIFIIMIPLYFFGIWDFSWIKNTLLWVICVAFVMLIQFSKANKENFFKNTIEDNLKILVILEFIINLYVFNLLIEMLLVPISAFIGGMLAVSDSEAKYKDVRKIFNFILVIMVVFFIGYATYMIITDFGNFTSKRNLIDFILPILLTIMLIPFIYLIALYSSYEALFVRMQFFIKNQNVLTYSKKKIFITFGFNLKKVNVWANHFNTLLISTKSDIDDALISFKKNRRTQIK